MEHYRSWLFSPADVPDRCLKALHSAADQVIWDLEDGVAHTRKDEARTILVRLLQEIPGGRIPWVRINNLEDLTALSAFWPRQRWVVPKMDQKTLEQFQHQTAFECADREWLFIIESARGLWDLAHSPGPWQISRDPIRLAFGSLDYLNDIGAQTTPEETELLGPRTLLPWISRAWNWPGPIDTVFPLLDDPERFAVSTQRSRSMGFAGRMIIHPQQIDPVNQVFSPSDAERRWAEQIMAHSPLAGAARIMGEMVDRPVLERARRILELAKQNEPLKENPQ